MITSRVLFIPLVIVVLCSCTDYPVYKTRSKGKISNNVYEALDSVSLVLYDVQAVQTKSGQNKVLDTIEIQSDDLFTTNSIRMIEPHFNLAKSSSSKAITRFPYKRFVPRFLNTLDYEGNVLVFFPSYSYSFSDEGEGGGGIGFAYDNGYQRHNVTHELYVAVYRDSQLIYSNNAVRFEQIRTKKGDSIKHEFPKAIADTLLNKALSDYVEQLE